MALSQRASECADKVGASPGSLGDATEAKEQICLAGEEVDAKVED